MSDLEAFILVGGKSSRMGRDKSLIEIDGKSFAHQTLETLQAFKGFSKITFVAANEAQFAIPAIQMGVPFIFDIYPDRGPLSGIHAALADARSEWIFLTACDYPFATVQMIELFASKFSGEHGAIVPEQADGRLQPLFAFYRAAPSRLIVNDIIEGRKQAPPMREIVGRLAPLIVRFGEYADLENAERIFHNLNSPGDLIERAMTRLSDAVK